MAQLNAASERVLGQMKYPAFHLSSTDTGEKFGLQYVEPGCRPVPVDWDKHRTKSDSAPPGPESTSSKQRAYCPVILTLHGTTEAVPVSTPCGFCCCQTRQTCRPSALLSRRLPLHWTCEDRGVFVLDHKRWPAPMKATIDNLLNKHRGMKDMLKLVDQDYAALVHNSCTDPNSMLHPTTKHHILQYIKHLCKLLNTSSSLNTSPEKLQERQELWHALTKGSETTRVPVVTMPVAVVNPPPPRQTLTKASIEQIVQNLIEKQQQHQQQQQQPVASKKQTKTCLSCGQPKSRNTVLSAGTVCHEEKGVGERPAEEEED
ncbi:uncharacterized protein LOC130210151 [Pseudoliparis swirei]|uniref:uncharacterized protein LOC130210151 n=1 Tax=Pseudoliparis swirei TaxID=2059687 RepID=UPI0024BEEDA4|nr:uncharacterized protein LOC130210151 [Pseudoliparis swirei]